MEEKIKQLESAVEVLKSTNNMLLDEIKRINSKIDAIDSKL